MTPDIKHSQPACAHVNGIELCYDTFGDPHAPPILLIAGMGNQMVEWDAALCAAFAARGYWVIRYDQRDVGKSSKVTLPGALDQQPYTFLDMANDAIGLLDTLDIRRAHVIGISMGGCLVQLMAIHYPERLRSMTSIQSFAKGIDLTGPRLQGFPVQMPESTQHDAFIREYIDWEQYIGGERYKRDGAYLTVMGEVILARGLTVEGRIGHAAAMVVTPDWYADLARVKTPSLVIHGDADPLVPVALGIATAKAIPGSKLMLIEGWGHGFPAPALWPRIIDAFDQHAHASAAHQPAEI
jgi:pimeloyl-ACP methyl ester carboxylesterase